MTKNELKIKGILKVVRNFIHSCKTTYLSVVIDISGYPEEQVNNLIRTIQSPTFDPKHFNLVVKEKSIEVEMYNLDNDALEKDILDEIEILYERFYNLMVSYFELNENIDVVLTTYTTTLIN